MVWVTFCIFYENFYFVHFIVDASTSFSLSPMEIAWVPKKQVGGYWQSSLLGHTEITSHFLWQWQKCATAKINTKQKPTEWIEQAKNEVKSHWSCKIDSILKWQITRNSINLIASANACIECNWILSQFFLLWLYFPFSVVKRPNKRYFIVFIKFGKQKKLITYLAVKMKIPNSFSIQWTFFSILCRYCLSLLPSFE